MDLCLIIDASDSIDSDQAKWDLYLEFIYSIASPFDISEDGSHVAAVVFSSQPTLEFSLDSFRNRNDVKNSIETVRHRGGLADTAAALSFAQNNCFSGSGDRPYIYNVAVTISNYVPTIETEREAAKAAAKDFQQSGVHLFSVSPTYIATAETFWRDLNDFFHQISSGLDYFRISKHDSLQDYSKRINRSICGDINDIEGK